MSGRCQEFDVHGAPPTSNLPRPSFFPSNQGGNQASTGGGGLMLNLNMSWFGDSPGFRDLFDRSLCAGFRVNRGRLVGFLLWLFR